MFAPKTVVACAATLTLLIVGGCSQPTIHENSEVKQWDPLQGPHRSAILGNMLFEMARTVDQLEPGTCLEPDLTGFEILLVEFVGEQFYIVGNIISEDQTGYQIESDVYGLCIDGRQQTGTKVPSLADLDKQLEGINPSPVVLYRGPA